MEYSEFRTQMMKNLPVGLVLPNPGGGTSEIKKYIKDAVVYQRGDSDIRVSIADLYDAYKAFHGKRVDSTDLRRLAPSVFDSERGGHSCNCTFLFMALQRMGIVDRVQGEGKSGSPFWVSIP